jgi:hypothetical protein
MRRPMRTQMSVAITYQNGRAPRYSCKLWLTYAVIMLNPLWRIASSKGALNAKQLAVIFGLARTGMIPCFRLGTSVRFDPKARCEWLDKG